MSPTSRSTTRSTQRASPARAGAQTGLRFPTDLPCAQCPMHCLMEPCTVQYAYTAHLPHMHVLSAQCTHGAVACVLALQAFCAQRVLSIASHSLNHALHIYCTSTCAQRVLSIASHSLNHVLHVQTRSALRVRVLSTARHSLNHALHMC